MSLLKHEFFPRSMFDTSHWLRPRHPDIGSTSLDLFDPFDDLDKLMAKNFHWLNRPNISKDIVPSTPRVPHKFRVTVDCKGFDSKSIKTEISKDNSKLIVTAEEGESKPEGDDYNIKKLKRTFQIPPNAEVDKLVSFVTSHGKLVAEMPIKVEHHKKTGRSKATKQMDTPKIVEDEKGNKTVQMNMSLPSNIDPHNVKVICKDRDIIVQYEETTETKDEIAKVHYYKSCTLPEETDFESLKCVCENDQLHITASIQHDHEHRKRAIPIEIKNNKKIKEN